VALRLKSVLCLSGHDPLGGAGVHADIEAVAAQGLHALSVITALTVQDSRNVRATSVVAPEWIGEQIEVLMADGDIAAVKIGLLGSAAQIPVIGTAIRRLGVPVVLDPVLRAGGGANLVDDPLQSAMLEHLLPQLTVLTPNAAEARRLVPGASGLPDCARALLARGCRNVLVTGGDEPGALVVNTWFRADAAPVRYAWPRIPETFHGAGCTLAASVAARLALGDSLADALAGAQRWTQRTLERAIAVGRGRRIPFRH
jgi:hydroxymethylpyrimidine/phosphomethylpyrimidine kinase